MNDGLNTQGSLLETPAAYLLAQIALRRLSGKLTTQSQEQQRSLWFHAGKTVLATSSRSQESSLAFLFNANAIDQESYKSISQKASQKQIPAEVILQESGIVLGGELRQAITNACKVCIQNITTQISGTYQFEANVKPPSGPPLASVDPLSITIMSIQKKLSSDDIKAVLSKDTSSYTTRLGTFKKIMAMLGKLQLNLPTDLPPLPCKLTQWAESGLGWNYQLVFTLQALSALETKQTEPAAAEQPTSDPDSLKAQQQIKEQFEKMQNMNYYELLGISEDSSPEKIKDAYFAMAQSWHSDSFSGLQLGSSTELLEKIFSTINEAHSTLMDPQKRESYLYYIDRVRNGLPTDIDVILEAEDVFRKAEALVDQGKMVSALPLLEKAIALNKGEAEFWLYYGYALFNSKGEEAYEEAKAHMDKAVEMQIQLKLKARLFLGQIERSRKNFSAAMKIFNEILHIQPQNKTAMREIRLIQMRLQKSKEKPEKKGFMDKLLGK